MMWSSLATGTTAFRATFHQSAVIWFARAQILLGAIWTVLIVTDLSTLISNPKYLTVWLVFSGIVTEMGRRSRTVEDDDGHLVPRRNNDENVTVVVNNASAAPAPASPLGPSTGATK